MEETLKLILNELKELKEGQQELKEGQEELKKDISSIKDNLINSLEPYFERIEKHVDVRTDDLKDTLED